MEDSNKINFVYIFRSIILLLYSFFFLWTVYSGSIGKYVHPRYIIFIIISCVISLIIMLALLLSSTTHTHSKIPMFHAILLILPLLSTYATRNMDVNFSDSVALSNDGFKYDYFKDGAKTFIPDYVKEARDSDSIHLDDRHYVMIMDDMYNNPYKYKGKSITVKGVVLKREFADKKEEFAIARMMMVCCAADVQPAGFICRYKNAAAMFINHWYIIAGTIVLIKIKNSVIPIIEVRETNKAEKPADEYVYPF
jgi:putative membrane protein